MKSKETLCLGLDTTSDTTSVACLSGMGESAAVQQDLSRGQGEVLFDLIQQVLQKMHKSPSDLTHIAVTVGPGSFTGVRIGLATARGLGLALNIPVLGIDNFLATAYEQGQSVKVVLDSKRDDYFVQDFNKNIPLCAPIIQTTAQLKNTLPFAACGNGAQKLAEQIGCTVIQPKQSLAMAAAQIALKIPQKTTAAHPLYLRDADVTI